VCGTAYRLTFGSDHVKDNEVRIFPMSVCGGHQTSVFVK